MRIENWDVWLVARAEMMSGKPFKWGSTDCVTLTRRCVTTMLGRDPWEGAVPKYKTKTAALKAAKSVPVEETLLATGATEVGYHFAWSGDVAVGPEPDKHGLPAVSILVPKRKALVSTQELGVIILDKLDLPRDTRFFRYG